jgi:hypothetical protein
MSIHPYTDQSAVYCTANATVYPGGRIEWRPSYTQKNHDAVLPLEPGIYRGRLIALREVKPNKKVWFIVFTWGVGQRELKHSLFLTPGHIQQTEQTLRELGILLPEGTLCLKNVYADLHIERAVSKTGKQYAKVVKAIAPGRL